MKTKLSDEGKIRKRNNINNYFETEISSYYERILVIMSSVFVWGILAHGFMIFNKFSIHDDIALFYGTSSLDAGIAQGRWMCSVYGYLLSKLYGFDLSLPLFKGLISFFFIAISWIILSGFLEIKNKVCLSVISGILVVVSSITSIFAYIYMSLYYTFGFLLSVCGGVLISKEKEWKHILLGVLLFLLAIGTYQMFFITGVCTIVVYMIKKVMDHKYENFKAYIIDGISYIFKIGITLGLYVIVTKVLVFISGIPLSTYKNIDKLGIVSIREYIRRIVISYRAFINPNKYVVDVPYPNICIILYHTVLFILVISSVILLYKMFSEGKRVEAVELIILLLIFPLAVNFIFVLAGDAGAIQYYGHVFVYILLAFMMESIRPKKMITRNILRTGMFITLIYLNIAFCRLSNACYLKLNLLQEHAISYFETLNARVQMTEGYTINTEIAFIEPRNKLEIDIMEGKMAEIKLVPYNVQSIINDYKWVHFVRIWCGYFPKISNNEKFENHPEVKAMPCYPDDGSIKMIDDVIVVKFNDSTE